MRKSRNLLITLLLLIAPVKYAGAEVAVLIHGYLSDASTWERSWVNGTLRQAGWRLGGTLGFSPAGVLKQTVPGVQGDKLFYTVNLPSLAPAPIQAGWLKAALDNITAAHPGEEIALIGHSAGGVVARLMLVQHGAGKVKKLITIAAPHLGTDRAIRALDAVDDDGMFGFIKEWFVREEIGDGLYRTLKVSRGILFNLVPPAPGTLLHWLNLQPHPDIEYVSVVRSSGYVIAGDLVVPPFSQDMNRVPALRGRSKLYITVQGHALTPNDGRLLAEIL